MTESDFNLLIVDDDDVTAESVARSLKRVGAKYRIVEAKDGREALDILRGKLDRRIAKPFVILLDLNMPRMNGFEFLEALRGDEQLRESVVFVLTTSEAYTDRVNAYEGYIAGYMVKASVGPQFTKLARLLTEYSQAVTLPE
jgi:CheY-like chemotaxis protein